MTISTTTKDDVEEGIMIANSPSMGDDTKSQTSEGTTPSTGSGSNASAAKGDQATQQPDTKRRQNLALGAVLVGVLVLICIIVGVVVGSSKNSKSNKKLESQAAGTASNVPPVDPELVDIVAPIAEPDPTLNLNDGKNFPAPFGDVKLPVMSQDTLRPYITKQDFQADLTLAAQNTVNKVIKHNLLLNTHQYGYGYEHDDHMHDDMTTTTMEQAATNAAVGMASASAKQASQAKIRKTPSLTNNQETSADEADLAKNDEHYVYAAFGDYLVIWDRQGRMVAQEKMPDTNGDTSQEEEVVHGTDDWYFYPGGSFLYIDSISLTDTHVLVTVGGMEHYSDHNIGYGEKGTHLRVYTKPTPATPSLTLVASTDIHGYFNDAKYLPESNSVHILTGGDFNTYSLLVEPLDKYHFEFLNKTEYYQAATRKAREELIPRFVQQVTDFFLETNHGRFPNTMKINSWKQQEETKQAPHVVDPTMPIDYAGVADEAYRAFLQVTSIQANALPMAAADGTTALPMSTSSVLGPASISHLYATQDSLVLNADQYEFNSAEQASSETLHLIHLKVNPSDGSTTFHGIGTLAGFLPNQYSVDIQGNDLRVGTTQQVWFPLDQTWNECGDSWQFEDACMNEDNWNTCFDTALNCRNMVKTGCPYTFTCQDEAGAEPESSTHNHVTVMDISQPGLMVERGSVEIGEPHEVITSIHFGETFSYAMTFDQRDPFYVLNLPAGQAPSITGVLKPQHGFSSYLQPLNDDATVLVGIGQNVTGTGMDQRATGLLVTVFDVSNKAAPTVLDTKALNPANSNSNNNDNPDATSSFSDAEFDNRAVQYHEGRLVIPVSILDNSFAVSPEPLMPGGEVPMDATFPPEPTFFDHSKNFDGFIVLDVSTNGIQEVMRINHASDGYNCHYCGGFNNLRRSFLYPDDDSLMTMYDSVVITTDLATGARKWAFNVTIAGEDNSCCY